jgi:HSP20 family protein
MANLARYDPYGMSRTDPFELLERFMQPARGTPGTAHQWAMNMELLEREDAYELVAEVPGLRKEDIDVTVSGSEVTIAVDVKEEKEAGGESRQVFSERWHGKTSRMIRLPLEIDQDRAEASCADGLLRLTLPKKASSMTKRLPVH